MMKGQSIMFGGVHSREKTIYRAIPASPASRTSNISTVGVVKFERPIDRIQNHREAILKYHLENRGTLNRSRIDAGPNSDDMINHGNIPYRLKAYQDNAITVPNVPTSELASVQTDDMASRGSHLQDSGNEDMEWIQQEAKLEQLKKASQAKQQQHRITGRTGAYVRGPIQVDNNKEQIQFKVSRLTSDKKSHVSKLMKSEPTMSTTSLPGIANLTRRGIKTIGNSSSNSISKLPQIDQHHDYQLASQRAEHQTPSASLKSQMWVMGLSFNDDDENALARRKYLKEMIAKKKIITDDKAYDMYARKKKRGVRRNVGVFHLVHGAHSNDSRSLDNGLLGNKDEQSVLSYRSAKTVPRLGLVNNESTTIGDTPAE